MTALNKVLCVGLLSVSPAWAVTTYYVSTTGNNSNACTSGGSSACASIDGAISKISAFPPSDDIEILVQNGTYSSGTVTSAGCQNNGTTHIYVLDTEDCSAANTCTIKAENAATGDSRDDTLSTNVTLNNAAVALCIRGDYWTVDGVTISGMTGGGLHLKGSFVNIQNSSIPWNSSHYIQSPNDITFTNVRLDNTTSGCDGTEESQDSYRMQMDKGTDNFTFQDSYLGHSRQIMTIRGADNGIVRRSVFQNTFEHGFQLMEDCTNWLFENNIIKGHGATGDPSNDCEMLSSNPNYTGSNFSRIVDVYEVQGITVRNNTVAGYGYYPKHALWFNYGGPNQCAAGATGGVCNLANIRVYNNIIFDTGTHSGSNWADLKPESVSLDYDNANPPFFEGNSYSGGDPDASWGCDDDGVYKVATTFAQWQGFQCIAANNNPDSPTGYYAAGTWPSFVDYEGEDLRPSSGTAAQVDAGVNGTDVDGVAYCASDDFDGNPRTDGNCDIGAFEFVSGGGGDPPPSTVQNLRRNDTASGQ